MMNSWGTNTLAYRGDPHRSLSSAGYTNDNRLFNQHCASYMDISTIGNTTVDTRRQFSWRSPISNTHTSSVSQQTVIPAVQGPFESAFKSAINKMKESSINRLGTVDQNMKVNQIPVKINDESTQKRYMTLQPKKILKDCEMSKPTKRIFRCNSISGLIKSDTLLNESASETETEKSIKIYKFGNNSDFEKPPFQKVPILNKSASNLKKDSKISKDKFDYSSHVVIPTPNNLDPKVMKDIQSVVSETYVSPKIANKIQSTFPNPYQGSLDNDDSPESESMPSVQNIIAKVEAMKFENENKRTSFHTQEKPEIKSNKPTNLTQNVSLGKKRISGLYKKNTIELPKAPATKNFPSDFQKLHSTFLEQKQEIQTLKLELEEKNNYIIQLESEIRNYEPWR